VLSCEKGEGQLGLSMAVTCRPSCSRVVYGRPKRGRGEGNRRSGAFLVEYGGLTSDKS